MKEYDNMFEKLLDNNLKSKQQPDNILPVIRKEIPSLFTKIERCPHKKSHPITFGNVAINVGDPYCKACSHYNVIDGEIRCKITTMKENLKEILE
jgi:hypothetical protein